MFKGCLCVRLCKKNHVCSIADLILSYGNTNSRCLTKIV